MKRVGGDGQPALVVDQLDGLSGRKPGRDDLLEKERQHVPVEGAFLADHDVDPSAG
jgi:hypothetical protein